MIRIIYYNFTEKKELVDLFCNKHIPEKQRRGVDKLTANFGDPLKPINGFLSKFIKLYFFYKIFYLLNK